MQAKTGWNAELVATGVELLNGRSVNTHARRLGEALGTRGISLARETTVPDDRAVIAGALREAMDRVPVVFVTGGLGPTCDDVTREALSDVLGRPEVEDAPTVEVLRARCESRGGALTPSRRRQARVLAGAEVLANAVGAAPGMRIEAPGGKTIFVLPGPPPEFEAVLESGVLPRLAALFPMLRPLPTRVFMVCGAGESDIVERLERSGFDAGPLSLAYCAAPGALEVRLDGRPGQEDEVRTRGDRLREILGADVYAGTREDLAGVVGRLLKERGYRLATAESCTGGLLGQRITAVAGSSSWYLGGVVAYANEVKVHMLNVPADVIRNRGAVSEEVARSMAAGARRRFGADVALATTGIAGPDGGTEDKPVGTVWMALADAAGTAACVRRFPGDRDMIRAWSAQHALDLLRRRLQGLE